MNRQSIREIALREIKPPVTRGYLNDALFVILLGAGAVADRNLITKTLSSRWQDESSLPESQCKLVILPLVYEGQNSFMEDNNIYKLKPALDAGGEVVLDAQLSYWAMVNAMTYGKDARICVLSYTKDPEAQLAAKAAMMLEYALMQYGLNVFSHRAYFLHDSSSVHDSNFMALKEKMQLWGKDKPEQIFYLYDTQANGFQAGKNIEGYFHTPLFSEMILLSDRDSSGTYHRDIQERYNLFASFEDPCSAVDWHPNYPNALANELPDSSLYSGFVYPNRLDADADIMLLWKKCDAEFRNLLSKGQNQIDPLAELDKANHELGITLEECQKRIELALPGFAPSGDVKEIDISLEAKFDYLWQCAAHSVDWNEAVNLWKERVQTLLNNCWNLAWLNTDGSQLAMEYHHSHFENAVSDADRDNHDFGIPDPISIELNDTETCQKIRNLIDKYSIGKPMQEKKVQEQIQLLNDYVRSCVKKRIDDLSVIRDHNAPQLENTCMLVENEFADAFRHAGVSNPEGALKNRSDQLMQHLKDAVSGLLSEYTKVEMMAEADREVGLEVFLKKIALTLAEKALVIQPFKLDSPKHEDQRYMYLKMILQDVTMPDKYPCFVSGFDTGKYYLLRNLAFGSI